ncbi:MAG: polymerase [Burkholderiales bacterium]|jgi:DNA recombination protein RmuC|nr:polymerase [Burkholderiales bacterium]
MSEILIAVTALVAGVAVAWVWRGSLANAKLAPIEQQLAERIGELDGLKADQRRAAEQLRAESERRAAAETRASRVPELEAQLAAQTQALSEHNAKLSELETRITEERKAAEEKLILVKQAEAALSDAFKALSSEALKSNNQAFLDLAQGTLEKFQQGAKSDLEARQKAVDELVKPIRESMEKVDGKLGEIEKARVGAYAELSTQVKGLVETHLPMLRNETANLVKALRQPTVRGRWGEIQLKRVVEMAGMLDHCDFVEQETRTNEDGQLRPDLVVRLPGGKNIVVDAKAPLTAYLNATETADEAAQQGLLAHHARQVRDHMVALGRKSYWEQFDPTPEFVVLFLPGEMFFSAALQQDPALIEFGASERVIPATPTTLISLLKAVAYGWRQEALAQNAHEIADLGKQLYERIAKLAEHWAEVGQRLDQAVEVYNKSVGTLESRVLVSARKLRDLKAAPEDVEIEVIEPVERTVRALQAPALSLVPPDGTAR